MLSSSSTPNICKTKVCSSCARHWTLVSGAGFHTEGLLQVVCTLGPKSRSVEVLSELLKAGMSVARFNFSHGSHDYHQVRKQCA